MDKTSDNSIYEGFHHKLKVWEDSDVMDDWVDRALGYAKIPDVDDSTISSDSLPEIVVVSESKDQIIYRIVINPNDVHSFKSETMINIDFIEGRSIALTFAQTSSADLAWKFICSTLKINPENKCTKSPYDGKYYLFSSVPLCYLHCDVSNTQQLIFCFS